MAAISGDPRILAMLRYSHGIHLNTDSGAVSASVDATWHVCVHFRAESQYFERQRERGQARRICVQPVNYYSPV